MNIRIANIASILYATMASVLAQSPTFEVASVKIAVEPVRDPMFCIGTCTFGERFSVVGSRVEVRFMSLSNLLAVAYRVKPYQLSGPEWMRTQKLDIAAKMPAGATRDQVPEMLRALLADRIQLSVHREKKEQAVYALVVGKGGPKLHLSTTPPAPKVNGTPAGREIYTPQGQARQLEDGTLLISSGPFGPMRGGRGASGGMRFEFLQITMPALAELLTSNVDRPVVDMTRLTGSYDLATENHPPSAGGETKKGGPSETGAPDTGAPPNLFAEGLFAAIEKAGLKLERTKAPVEMIIVDHLEKTPTAN